MHALLPWFAVVSSVLMVTAYELLLVRRTRRDPGASARSAHRLLRAKWVSAMSRQPNSELLAVQALRNSLMSATITASTAALVLMGSVSLVATSEARAAAPATSESMLRLSLEVGLTLALFAAYVCSAMAMRYYHHAGFILSMQVGSPERQAHEPLANHYVQRGGVLYSWSLRCFLFAAPIATGMLNPLVMPLSAVALVIVLIAFDRGPLAVERSAQAPGA